MCTFLKQDKFEYAIWARIKYWPCCVCRRLGLLRRCCSHPASRVRALGSWRAGFLRDVTWRPSAGCLNYGRWCSGAMFPKACWRFLGGSAGSSNIAGWARGLLWSGGLVVTLLLSSGVRCVLVDRQARWTIGLAVGSLLEARDSRASRGVQSPLAIWAGESQVTSKSQLEWALRRL